MDIEREMAAYAGRDYAARRRIKVDEYDMIDAGEGKTIDAVIAELNEFRIKNAAHEIEGEFDRGWDGDRDTARFAAYRFETDAELAARIDEYRQYVIRRQAQRRAEYEHMKREFGDA